MTGIKAFGAYIPLHRLSRSEISRAWGGSPGGGERAVASFDEDSITMGVEAAMDCLKGIDPKSIDGLFFATTTAPYKERMCSAIMAVALDLRGDVRTMDVTGSLRAGTAALNAALDAVQAGSLNNVLVVSSDCRLGAPSGDIERSIGDGAAALLLSREEIVAEISGRHSISDEFSGVWRADGDTFVRSWEDRMVIEKGYAEVLPRTISQLMKKHNSPPDSFTKVVYNSPNELRWHSGIAPQMKIDPAKLQDAMLLNVGNTGTAQAPMMLVGALEAAKPGDKILFANYGNGSDAFILTVTPVIEKLPKRRGIKAHTESKMALANYETYLRWRGLITLEAARRPEQSPTSIAALRRYRKEILALYGGRCLSCGTPQWATPQLMGQAAPVRVCVICQAKDHFEPYRFADKKATVFSYARDNLMASPNPPSVSAVLDFEGGGRGIFDMTDRDPDQVKAGMSVEMTFRKLYSDRGIHNYFWKARPIRCQ